MLDKGVRFVRSHGAGRYSWSDDKALAGLLGQVAAHDREAFALLYQATSPKLLGVVTRILSDRQLAEDVVQDVFVTVWRKAADYDPARARPTTWLLVIARNRAIDVLRSSRTGRSTPIDASTDGIADAAPSADTIAEHHDEVRRVQEALGELDERHARLIRDTYLGGLSYEDAALRAGIPTGTAKTWVHRGLMRLKQRLAP